MKKQIKQLKPGDKITSLPYADTRDGGYIAVFPITVDYVLQAKAKGCRIIEGTDAKGVSVLRPVGHWSNVVEVL